jgi:hypothetical protein
MKAIKFLSLASATLAMGTFAACSLDTHDNVPTAPGEIIVDAQFDDGANTRALVLGDGVGADAKTAPLDLTLLYSQAANIEKQASWPAKPTLQDAVLSSDLKIQTGIKYATNHTVLTAVYPRVTIAAVAANGDVSYDISDGKIDVLCASPADAGTKIAPTPNLTFEFNHMLSQMVVSAQAADANSISRCGRIEKMTLKSVPTAIVVALPTPDNAKAKIGVARAATVPAAKDVVFSKDNSNDAAPEMALEDAKYNTFGNVMFLPGATTLQLEVVTENFDSFIVDVPASLFSGTKYEAGMKYMLKLTFNDDTIVFDAASTIVPWDSVDSTSDIQF